MNDIKFRIWSRLIERWISDLSLDNLGDTNGTLNDILLNNNLVFQRWTGLKDGGNNDIYEGDILFCINRVKNKYIEVKYDNSRACFLFDNRLAFDFFKFNDVIVEGNILENPYLIKNS